MVDNEMKPDDMKPWQLLTSAWAVLLCLFVVFAGDFNNWAVAADDTAAGRVAQPLAGVFEAVADASGVATVRATVEETIHPVYDHPLVLGERNSRDQVSTLPDLLPAPTTAAAVPAGAATPAEQTAAQAPVLPRPARVLIIGDSSIEAGLGTDLERRLEQFEDITVLRFGRHSTGLARPDYFNWNDKLAELQAEFSPDLVITYFGDNDCQGLSSVEGAFVAKFGTDEWDAVYGERVTAIVEQIQEGECRAVIVGMPIMRSRSFSNKVERLNGVVATAVEAAGGIFLPTWGLTSDDAGKYISSVEFGDKTRMIRAGDGIHFSSHGSAYVANGLIAMLEESFHMVLADDQ